MAQVSGGTLLKQEFILMEIGEAIIAGILPSCLLLC